MSKSIQIAILSSGSELAQSAYTKLEKLYPHVQPKKADVIVALGGDGFMLETLHHYMAKNIPFYGMNLGTMGFLMNNFKSKNLMKRVQEADKINLHPLVMHTETLDGVVTKNLAINEVSLLRETRQTAKLKISIDGKTRIDELISDGCLISTPAGSTAYNLSVGGPILPLQSNVIALTPISAFRPRRWRGAILPHDAEIEIEILDPKKRPISAVADSTEIRDVKRVTVKEDKSITFTLLFDPEHNLDERIFAEQFMG